MGLEAILSELRNRRNTLFLSFRNVGSFFVDGYQHTFPAIVGERKNKKKVTWAKERVAATEALKDFKINDNTSLGFDEKIAAFEIMQIEAPIYYGNDQGYSIALRKEGKLEKGKKAWSPLLSLKGKWGLEFFTGHYKKQAEMLVGPVAAYYSLDEQLVQTLRMHKSYHPLAQKIRNRQKLGTALEAYDGKDLELIREAINKKNFEEHIDETKAFGKHLLQLQEQLSAIGPSHVAYDQRYTTFDIHFDFDITESKLPIGERRWIRFDRARTAKELLSDKATNFDIEKFEFDSPEDRVDLDIMFHLQNGKISNRTVLSRYPLTKKRINNYSVVPCADADSLVDQAKDFVLGRKPSFVLTAYNAPFDAIEMREEGNFAIGARGSDPKKESTTKFFEKIGVYSKHVLDPLDIAKTLFAHLPNRKMDMVAKELGCGEKTGMNYRQGRELSITARTGATNHLQQDSIALIAKRLRRKQIDLDNVEHLQEVCTEILIDYATHDGEVMGAIQQTERFQKALEDRVFISTLFNIDPFKVFHDPNRINDAQEKCYFENVGLHRDDVYKRWKVMIEYERKAMARFNNFVFTSLPKPKKRGLFKHVYKVFVPVARFFEDHLARNFPPVKELIAYTDQFSDDTVRQADLAQHEDRLCKLMIQDYAVCMFERDKFLKQLTVFRKERNISNERNLFGNFNDDLFRLFYSMRNKMVEQEDHKKRYRDYNATQDILRSYLTGIDWKFMNQHGLMLKDFQSFFNQWAKVQDKERKVYGNYGVRAFYYPYAKDDIHSIEETLLLREDSIFQFAEKHDLEILHIQGNYMYIKGEKDACSQKDCPFFLVDELEKVLVTHHPSDQRSREKGHVLDQKIYYAKHGFFEGISIDEDPTFALTVFEMETYGDFVSHILEGNYEEALLNMYAALDCLSIGKVATKDLVWVSKAKQRYKAFDNGEFLYFYTDKSVVAGQDIKFDDFRKKAYVEEFIGQTKRNVYIMQIEDIEPDWDMYRKRIYERAKDLLEPFIGNQFERFVSEVISDEAFSEMAKKIIVH